MTAPGEPQVGVDWRALAHRWNALTADMLHAEDTELRGNAFHAEALRRLLGHPGSGFITEAAHEHTIDVNTKVLKWRVEAAEATVTKLRNDLPDAQVRASEAEGAPDRLRDEVAS